MGGDHDVVVCGASFAGLAVARELARTARPARVLLIDRYDIGDKFGFVRATVAYALKRPDLKDKVLQYLKTTIQ